MDMILHLVAFAVGVVAGVLWYQYQLKNHPEKLEAWLKQIKAKHSTLDSYFDDAVSKVEDLGDKVVAEVQQAATSTAAAARSAVGENLITRLERALADAKAKIRDATK